MCRRTIFQELVADHYRPNNMTILLSLNTFSINAILVKYRYYIRNIYNEMPTLLKYGLFFGNICVEMAILQKYWLCWLYIGEIFLVNTYKVQTPKCWGYVSCQYLAKMQPIMDQYCFAIEMLLVTILTIIFGTDCNIN